MSVTAIITAHLREGIPRVSPAGPTTASLALGQLLHVLLVGLFDQTGQLIRLVLAETQAELLVIIMPQALPSGVHMIEASLPLTSVVVLLQTSTQPITFSNLKITPAKVLRSCFCDAQIMK